MSAVRVTLDELPIGYRDTSNNEDKQSLGEDNGSE